MTLVTQTYADAGSKDLIILSDKDKGIKRFTIKAGETDSYDLEVQMDPSSQRVKIPTYSGKSGDVVGRIPYETYGIGMYIKTNNSGAITIDIQEI